MKAIYLHLSNPAIILTAEDVSSYNMQQQVAKKLYTPCTFWKKTLFLKLIHYYKSWKFDTCNRIDGYTNGIFN